MKYYFIDEHMESLFKLLHKPNILKLLEIQCPDKMWKTSDSNYCSYHKMLDYPTSSCYILKDKLQVLVDAGTMKIHPRQQS